MRDVRQANSQEPTDEALIAAYLAGDRAAARMLTLRHLPRVLAVAQRMLGDRAEAEDIAQEAMLRLWRTAPDWTPGGAKLSTWLYRVTSNLAIDRIRRRRPVAPLDSVPEPQDDRASALDGLEAAERQGRLAAALSRLPDRQRLALSLRFDENLSNGEIAEVLEISVDAVESLVARAKRGLRSMLGEE
ncbi:MAG: RNA polymerase sigma factor [Rubricella sp.]